MRRFFNFLHSTFYILHSLSRRRRSAFTLIELLVFTGIFSVAIVAFVSILVSITKTQVRQLAISEVNEQSQFALQTIQYYAERSSTIDLPVNVATTSVSFRMTNAAEDPTKFYLSSTTIYSKVGAGAAQAITSNKVLVSNFVLVKHSNANGKDSLSVNFNVAYNTANPTQRFTQTLQSAVARVNAATFDSGLFPLTSGNLKVGANGQAWQSINDTIYFGASNNVGIGGVPGTALFQISSGDLYINDVSRGVIFNTGSGCFRWKPNISGNFTSSSVACP